MKIPTLSYSLVFLCASLCCGEEDDYTLTAYDDIQENAVFIENDEINFAVNDTLFFEIAITDAFDIDGEQLSSVQVLGNDATFYGNVAIQKLSEFENPQPLILSENEIITEVGTVNIYNQGLEINTTPENGMQRARMGVVLRDAGSYFISSYEGGSPIYFTAFGNETQISVETTIRNVIPDNNYYFTVE